MKVAADATQAWQPSAVARQRLDELLDEGLKLTFPASDPVAIVQHAPERSPAQRRRRARRARIVAAAPAGDANGVDDGAQR